jgi:hypothetical protein
MLFTLLLLDAAEGTGLHALITADALIEIDYGFTTGITSESRTANLDTNTTPTAIGDGWDRSARPIYQTTG